MLRHIMLAAVASCLVSAAATARTDAPPTSDQQATRQALEACLSSEAKKGVYTTSDGGISALRLMDQCKPELAAWCRATGQTPNQCSLIAAFYAHAALKQSETPTKPQ